MQSDPTMGKTVSDLIVERLHAWGVRTIYGYPGDGINGVLAALEKAKSIEFVQVRHEESAAFMAGAHAKWTGEVGVCMATSGPGAIHLLNGLYDASMDHQPVVAIVGQSARTALGSDYQQEVDLHSLFKDVAHQYVHDCVHPAQARHLIDRAMRIAFAERTVTCVILPNDIQELDAVDPPPHKHSTTLSGIGFHRGVIVPHDYDLQAAAEIINDGEKVAILVGAGAIDATDEVIELAERTGGGIAKALLGKAAVPDDLPFVTGSMGLLGTKASDDMIKKCDTLVMIGTTFPYVEYLPKEGAVKAVQIDIAPKNLALRYPADVALHGESRATLRALLPLIENKTDRGWREQIEGWVSDWWKVLKERAMADAEPVNPQRVFWELSDRLPDRAILTADSGSVASWWARDLVIRRGMMASLSGNLATMGPAVPYAIAAKLAYPDRCVVASIGDGAMQMLGNNELVTISARWQQWTDPRLVIVVLNNGDLNMVTWEQRTMAGMPKFLASQDLPKFPYARYAQMLGLGGIEVESPDSLGAAFEKAFAMDRPVIVEVHTDPEVPPLPPHISWEQGNKLMASLIHGDPDRWRMIKQIAKQMWATVSA